MLCSLEIGHLATEGLSRVVEAADVAASNFQTKYFVFMLAESLHEKIKGGFKKACKLLFVALITTALFAYNFEFILLLVINFMK